nr:4Fe-4S binding protein [Candidatus Sigynarchaeum springense]MDO8118473.1 4Fe-4S binding protein [Candidatus Sigynarchaeota archaeon]
MNKKVNRGKQIKPLPAFKSSDELPHIPISLGVPGSIGKTGEWRTFKPVIDQKICNKCGFCYTYCPEGTISFDKESGPAIDYDYCKGCGICAHECPKGAINFNREKQGENNES